MKRCPECGFRADDNTCPLCGVRMRPVQIASKELKTHAHRQTGERCVLPNQCRQPSRQPVKTGPERKPEKKTPQVGLPPKLLPVLVVILIAMLRACAG